MGNSIRGIHHITAIAGDPQQNVGFYTGLLGLRLVKLTVNFDDPGTYHLYYGDLLGTPGTLLTFFAWPGAPQGRRGAGQATSVAFAIAPDSVDYWAERLTSHAIPIERPARRFDKEVIAFHDPDGLALELVAAPETGHRAEWGGVIPAEHGLRGFYGVTLAERDYQPTASFLTERMGFHPVGQEGSRYRYQANPDGLGAVVDVLHLPEEPLGKVAAGMVHHVAWRTPADDAQAEWRQQLAALGLHVSPVMDRVYFHSIYFREPGGVLFEIATDPPGFGVDEPPDALGSGLMLPPWLEQHRPRIEAALPPLRLPQSEGRVAS